MAWLRIDDVFDTHPKIVALKTDDRRFTWIRVLIYTCRHRTDVIPDRIRDVIPKATPRFLEECRQLGLVDEENGKLRVHDWSLYQAGDPRKAARQRRWRKGHVDAPVDGDVDADVDGHVDAPVDANVGATRAPARARARPDPARTTKEGRKEGEAEAQPTPVGETASQLLARLQRETEKESK